MSAAIWLGELHTLAVRFSGLVVCPAALGLMVAQIVWFFLLMLGLTVGGVDD